MPFRVVGGKLDLSPTGIVCQLHDGVTGVLCTIPRQVLRDLGDFYRIRGSEEAVFSELLPEIERVVTRKSQACRIDEDGKLTLSTVDLLRYTARH